ncbi:hypothetical protein HRbin15_01246 [bacterium HR15]|nr:hypothetical protein HRbin15_01246 [bacterium HR15]
MDRLVSHFRHILGVAKKNTVLATPKWFRKIRLSYWETISIVHGVASSFYVMPSVAASRVAMPCAAESPA